MPLVSLKPVLAAAQKRGAACLGLVCLGWEDGQAYVAAAEAAQTPVVLSVGPSARSNMPTALWGAMLRELGARADVPVVAHLDHGKTVEECETALAAGFTSLMIDGSLLPLEDNIALSHQVCDLVKDQDISVEAELGEVGYQDGADNAGTVPSEVTSFLTAVPCDALAVSIGNSHMQAHGKATIDFDLAGEIARRANCPLVLHGGSGVRVEDRRRLAAEFGVHKFNVGTQLRRIFGLSLRDTLNNDTELFDRLTILGKSRAAMTRAATGLLKAAWG